MTAVRTAAEAREREMVPRVLVRAMFGLVAVVLALVTFARLTDRPLEAVPQDGEIAQERVIEIHGTMAGAAKVVGVDGALIADLDPTEGGFIAGIWRSLNHERAKRDLTTTGPVRLVRFKDGRLALFDDQTGYRVELMGFGVDNHAAFAQLLEN